MAGTEVYEVDPYDRRWLAAGTVVLIVGPAVYLLTRRPDEQDEEDDEMLSAEGNDTQPEARLPGETPPAAPLWHEQEEPFAQFGLSLFRTERKQGVGDGSDGFGHCWLSANEPMISDGGDCSGCRGGSGAATVARPSLARPKQMATAPRPTSTGATAVIPPQRHRQAASVASPHRGRNNRPRASVQRGRHCSWLPRFGTIVLLASITLGVFCLYKGLTSSQLRIRPIEQIRVGQRVVAHNPELTDQQRTQLVAEAEPDPATWRLLKLQMTKPDGGQLGIELLRPVAWLAAAAVRVDPQRTAHETVAVNSTIQLDLPELGARGAARLLSVGPCPPIQPGPGRVVTGTFRHTGKEVITLTIRTSDGDTEQIGVTPNHPIWSQTRRGFVSAGELRIGEQLRGLFDQQIFVASISARGPPEPVYNLEVAGEHVYAVTAFGIAVHNNCAYDRGLAAAERHGGKMLREGHFLFPSRKAARRAASKIVGNIGRDTRAIRVRDFRGAPASMRNSNRVIGRVSADGFTGWRDDFFGHPRFGAGPHINVWVNGVSFHLWY